VTVHLDTSAVIDAFTGPRRSLPKLTALVSDGHRVAVSTFVLYEWLRGPRLPAEVAAQKAVLPPDEAVPFTVAEAARAAALNRELGAARGREIDLAIAACALQHGAALWSLNHDDFADIPNLTLL
jgi:predicted nucleic acid-binding protein